MYAVRISVGNSPGLTGSEIADLLALTDRWAHDSGASPFSDHLRLALRSSSDPAHAPDAVNTMVVSTMVVSIAEPSGIVAYAVAAPGAEGMICEAVISPSAQDQEMLTAQIVSTTAQALLADNSPFQAMAAHEIIWWVDDEITAPDRAAPWTLAVDRTLYEMKRQLATDSGVDAAPLAHVTTRSFVVGQDDQAWIELNNRAFAGHPEQAGWNQELLDQRFAEPWFDADGFRIYESDGKIAAFCWTKIHADRDPVAGEIYVIAVDPAFHGKGLGRELTLAGLDAIAAEGITTAILYVDAHNLAAVNLYRSLGFEVERVRTAYRVVRID